MPKEEEMVSLPAVDLSDTEENIVRGMYDQMTTLGFLQLKNVEGFDETKLLQDIKQFHSMPDTEKRKLYTKQFNPENSNMFHGLFPFIDNDASHKEFFDMGAPYDEADEFERTQLLVEDTRMPDGPQYVELVARYRAHEAFARTLAIKVAEYLAMGLGKDRHFFREWFTGAPLSTFRTIKYLPRNASIVRSDSLDEEA